ncbi:MAG: hypothetical protein ACRERU_08290 [Methylococcales bacterium]
MSRSGNLILLSSSIFLLAFFLCAVCRATQLYRWADETGHIYYADKVPPQHSKYGRVMLNEQGITVDVVERTKTKAEIERETKLRELSFAEQQLLQDPLARDRSLLRTFRSEKEIDDTFRAKLATLEILETVNLANISRLESQLDAQQKLAADFERTGKTVPEMVVDNILGYQKQIARNREKLRELESQKLDLRKAFAADLDRFKALTERDQEKYQGIRENQPLSITNQDGESIILSVAECPDVRACAKAWEFARNYLLQHSTTEIRIDTDLIIYTSAPENDDDIALSLAKIQGKDNPGAQVFLDVRCKQSSIGQEVCSGAKVRDILASFPPYIATGLKLIAE